MASLPEMRGTGLLPAVAALQSDPDKYAPFLPDHLRHYLDLRVDPNDWYPTEEVLALLQVFAHVEMPGFSTEQRFQYFGAVAARRDLEGTQEAVMERFRTVDAGVWKGAVRKGLDHGHALRRMFGLHQLYYDAGEFQLERSAERVVSAKLMDFPAKRELCHLALGYSRAIAEIVELPATIEMTACRVHGDEACVFTVLFADDTDVSDLLSI